MLQFFVRVAALALLCALSGPAAATPYFVATNGNDTTGDGLSWATAWLTISNAVAQTTDGDTVTVSNGTYNIDAQIAVSKGITLQSLNDATSTIVNRSAIGTNAPQHRIFYLNHANAVVDGFTITNGYLGGSTSDGGGTYTVAGTLRNCTLTGNYAGRDGGGAYYGFLTNCTIVGNYAVRYGGGVCGKSTSSATQYNCTVVGNATPGTGQGGGAMYSVLYNCTIVSNSAGGGGGLTLCTVYNSMIVSNSTTGDGGGTWGGSVLNCTLSYNSAANGGGATRSYMYNCLLIGNRATLYGGGYRTTISGESLYNCTIVGNSAGGGTTGGGVDGGTLYSCISWGNNKVDGGLLTYYSSCGTGYTNGGSVSGNITNDPLFVANGSGYGTNHVAGNYRLRNISPPLNAGTNLSWMTDPNNVRSKDLDGQRRIDRFSRQVDMGCYELMLRGTLFIIGQ